MKQHASLAQRTCIACRGGMPLLDAEQQQPLLAQLPAGWSVPAGHHLEKVFRFRDFAAALAFTNVAARIAQEQNHHPEITLTWGQVTIRIWTHKVDGLTGNDFILAARIDQPPTGDKQEHQAGREAS